MSHPYQIWTGIAQNIFASYSVPLRRQYSVKHLYEQQALRDAIRDTWYAMYQWMRANNVDRMGEGSVTYEDMQIRAVEFVVEMREYVREQYTLGNHDIMVGVDPTLANIETRRLLNETELRNRTEHVPRWEEGINVVR